MCMMYDDIRRGSDIKHYPPRKLFASYGVTGNMVYDDISMLDDELESWDIEEHNDWDFYKNPPWTSERGSKVLVNVDSFGAIGDGVSDDTQAFQKAWDMACNSTEAVLLIPEGRHYLVNATKF